jgi:hypothetical protein
MAARLPEDERLQDLLALRALEGLDATEEQELDALTPRYPDFDAEAFDRVAAALTLAGLRVEPMPDAVRARVQAGADAYFAAREEARAAPATAEVAYLPARPRPTAARGGWFAAAAALVLAAVGWWQVDRMDRQISGLVAQQAAAPRAAEQLLAELQARPGTQVIAWSATEDPAAGGAGGAVVWNGAEQAGLMRFRGLAPNDPAVAQYQLWIFDAERDERFPVDGGVFDVPPGADEVLVPIRARLPVGEAVLFAITVEPPGGVVVSSRERIALVAQPGA